MADIEKVIKGMEDIQKHLDTGYSFAISWESELIRDTIALLKEQHERIETLEKINAIDLNPKWPYVFNTYRKVVLCKDCKFYGTIQCPVLCAPEDWFCADGEKSYD